MRQEQQGGQLHDMPVLLAPLHARHPAREGFVLLHDGLVEGDLPAQRIGALVKLLAEGGGVICEQHTAHLLEGHAVAAQCETVQQPARFPEGIIAIAVLRGARTDEAKLLVMLEKVGGYTHISGILADAVGLCILPVFHARVPPWQRLRPADVRCF